MIAQEKIRNELLSDFSKFVMYVFPIGRDSKFILNWHHMYYFSICEDIYNGKLKNVIINSPYGSGNTIIFSELFPLWCALKNNSRFILSGYSDHILCYFMEALKCFIDNDKFKEIFPEVDFTRDTNNKRHFNLMKKSGEIYTISIESARTGIRAGYVNADVFSGAIVVDTPMKNEDTHIPKRIEKTYNYFNSVLRLSTANKNVPIIVITPRHYKEDITTLLMKDESFNFTNIIIPAIITEDYINTLPENIKMLAKMELLKNKNMKKASYFSEHISMEELKRVQDNSDHLFKYNYMQGL